MRSMCYVFLFVVQVWCFVSGVLHAMHKEPKLVKKTPASPPSFKDQFATLTQGSEKPIDIYEFYQSVDSKKNSSDITAEQEYKKVPETYQLLSPVKKGQKLLDFIFYKTKKEVDLAFARTVELVLLAGPFLRLVHVHEKFDEEYGSGVVFRFVVPLLSLYNELDEVKKIELKGALNNLNRNEESSAPDEGPPSYPGYQIRVCSELDKLFLATEDKKTIKNTIALVGGGFLDLFYWSKEFFGPGDWRKHDWWSLSLKRKEDYNFSKYYKNNEEILKNSLKETVSEWIKDFKTWNKERFLLEQQQAAKMKEELLIQQEKEQEKAEKQKLILEQRLEEKQFLQQSLRERYKTWSKYALGILSIGSVALFVYWLYRKKTATSKR